MAVEIPQNLKYLLYILITLIIVSFVPYELLESSETKQTQILKINEQITIGNSILNRLQTRSKYLQQMCLKYNISNNSVVDSTFKRIIYNPTYNLMYCYVPKCGASTMVQMFRDMLKVNHTTDFTVHAKFILSEYELKSKLLGIHPTIKVMNCRDPLQRMVSGYKDKFRNGQNDIIMTNTIFGYAFNCLKLGKVQPHSTLSFAQYLKYIITCDPTEEHWANINNNSLPCTIKYDYILRLETFDDDLSTLFKELGVKGVDINLRINSYPTNTSYLDYYRTLPTDILLETYEKIKLDMVLFGYELPDFYKDVLNKNNVKILD